MTEIIIAVTIATCFAVIAFAVVASVKIVVAFKTAKLTIGANGHQTVIITIKRLVLFARAHAMTLTPGTMAKSHRNHLTQKKVLKPTLANTVRKSRKRR